MTDLDIKFMRRAIKLAKEGMESGAGGPFGAVVVKNGEIIAEGHNQVTSSMDPTAHAEVVAIRKACTKLDSFQLDGCTIYSSCEPCPMCLGAIYWARPDKVYFACDKKDAAEIDFDDQFIYDQLDLNIEARKIPFQQIIQEEALPIFEQWAQKNDRTDY